MFRTTRLTGTEALLRNVLTPSIAMEGGYRSFRVLTKSGRIVQGLLVSQDAEAVVLRMPDTADRRIEKSEIERAGFTSLSVMPNGLLDNMTPQDVSNLFTHLHSLTQKGTPEADATSSIRNAGRPGARDGFVLPNGNVLIARSDEN